jgi:methylmalonyl-CoA/ethylmalonyl-CoA epimerase
LFPGGWCGVVAIHHTGVVVRSIAEAYAFYRDTLGLRVIAETTIEDQGVRAALLDLGNSLLELLEPVVPDTGIARYLERRGEGLHHVCLEVDDLRASLAGLKSKGVQLIDEEPRAGLVGSIAFIHPGALHGVLVELVDGPTAVHRAGAPS